VATAVIDGDRTVKVGPFTGMWAAERQQRRYRITWPKSVDDMTLSDDRRRVEGRNQYGVVISGERLPGCS
jgi:hypothetical protein